MLAKSQRPKWSIAKKGFCIIGISLLTQLLLFLGNAWLLQQTEFIMQKEYHSREVLGHTNWIAALIANATQAGLEFSISGDQEARKNYQTASLKVADELDALSNILSNDSSQKAQLERLRAVWGQIKAVINPLLELSTTSPQVKITQLSKHQKQLLILWSSVMDARHQLLLEERTRVNTIYESSTTWRHTLYWLLVLGVGASILAALLIFNEFSKQIVHRIDRISENVTRLENGQNLTPVVSGSDEIAEFDQTFHHMADALTQAKRQLEQSERQVVTMIDNMPVGLMVTGEAGKVEFANPTAKDLFGFDPKDSQVSALIPSSNSPEQASAVSANSGTGIQFQRRNEITGELLMLEVSKREITIAESAKTLYTLQDITQKYELDRLKGEFVAIVSHDLRTPLSSIELFLTLVEETAINDLSDDMKKSLSIAQRSTDRMLNLVNDILDFAKVEAGQFTVRPAPTHIGSVIDQSVQAISDFANKHEITVDKQYPDIICEIDEERLIQVLINLLSNAIKFSPDGGRVSVTAKADSNSDSLLVSVKDHGRGIPKEFQSSIFEKYKQVSATDARRGQGTGLGLPICKAIIEQHGGTIGVESAPDQGTTMWFTIPVKDRSQFSQTAPASS